MKIITRILVTLVAILFAGIGLEFWIVPEQAAHQFGVEAIRAIGLANLRADFGGFFLGLALLCIAGVWTSRRAGVVAAIVILATAAVGRSIGLVVENRADIGFRELAIELIALAALFLYARSIGLPREGEEQSSRKPLKVAMAVLVVITLLAASALLIPSVQQAIFDRAATQMSARVNAAPLEDDALRVAICGSSAPLPSHSRGKACAAVFAGGKFWIVDAGPESVENLVLWRIPLSQIGGVFLTHFHSDHIGDLGELQIQTWAGGRPQPLAVYGGPGIEGVVEGFNQAYRLDQGYRTRHHGEKVMPSATWGMVARRIDLNGLPTSVKDRTAVVFDEGSVRITAIEVDHAPIEPAYAYRFDYEGRSAVITGDLKFHPPLVKSATNVDLLISEAISRSMTSSLQTAAHSVGQDRTAAIMHDIQDYHISPEEAARIANDAKVHLLVFYHLLPAPDGFLPRRLFAHGVNEVRKGDWTIADDGSLYTLPLASKEIQIGRISD